MSLVSLFEQVYTQYFQIDPLDFLAQVFVTWPIKHNFWHYLGGVTDKAIPINCFVSRRPTDPLFFKVYHLKKT